VIIYIAFMRLSKTQWRIYRYACRFADATQ